MASFFSDILEDVEARMSCFRLIVALIDSLGGHLWSCTTTHLGGSTGAFKALLAAKTEV